MQPPSEDRAREVIKPLAAMNSQALIDRISEEVGEAGLTLFRALSDAAMPGESMDSGRGTHDPTFVKYASLRCFRRPS